jgi:hypothetical protein
MSISVTYMDEKTYITLNVMSDEANLFYLVINLIFENKA